VIVSPTACANLVALEEAASDKLDAVESEKILRSAKWIDCEQQLKVATQSIGGKPLR
jgi:hypothetical protein